MLALSAEGKKKKTKKQWAEAWKKIEEEEFEEWEQEKAVWNDRVRELEAKVEELSKSEENGRTALSEARTRVTSLERKMGEMMAAVRKARGQATEAERARVESEEEAEQVNCTSRW